MLTRISHYFEFAALRLLRWIVLALGVERGAAVMGFVWRSLAPLTKRHPRAQLQIQTAMPELSAAQRDHILSNMWEGLGQTFAEGLVLDRLGTGRDRITFTNPAILDADHVDLNGEQDRPRTPGLVLVSMHSANWEMFGIGLAKKGIDAAAMYQSVANPLVDVDLQAKRSRYWTSGMITKGSNAIKRTIGLLRSGKGIGILADHRTVQGGVAVPFFNHPAPTTPLPASLALKTGARLIVGRCCRTGLGAYTVEIVELEAIPSGNHARDVERVTAAIQAQFEAWIRERPHEWMWAHRRWSREPLGTQTQTKVGQ